MDVLSLKSNYKENTNVPGIINDSLKSLKYLMGPLQVFLYDYSFTKIFLLYNYDILL